MKFMGCFASVARYQLFPIAWDGGTLHWNTTSSFGPRLYIILAKIWICPRFSLDVCSFVTTWWCRWVLALHWCHTSLFTCTGSWIPEEQAVLALWERLHLRQVWVLLERQRQVPAQHRMVLYLDLDCSCWDLTCICCHPPFSSVVMTGSYNNFFRMFDRSQRRDVMLEASRENSKPMQVLKPRKVCAGGKRKKDEISVDSLDFNKKILHTAWHPQDNIIAVATTNNLYIFQDKVN